ncbi:MAG: hypothetical protein LH632_19830 [Rhodoferax sp.]|nr:hypothetical protein [Rhodoferax sp.]
MARQQINLGFMSMRHAGLRERVEAAASAGFDGISLRADQWQQTLASGWDAASIQSLLLQHRLRVSEVEPMRFLRDDLLDTVEEMVHAFQVLRVQVTPPLDGKPLDLALVPRPTSASASTAGMCSGAAGWLRSPQSTRSACL